MVACFKDLYPEAPIYTTACDLDKLDPIFAGYEIRTSFLQRFPHTGGRHRWQLPLMPYAWEQFDFTGYDLVLSSHHCCAKGLITPADTLHICYCHTPMRYAWDAWTEYRQQLSGGRLKKAAMSMVMHGIRTWDAVSAQRVDYFIANSENVARRIRKHYRREAVVIPGPIQANFFNISGRDEEYYLIVSRLVPYKKIDLAIHAFNALRLPLVIIGTGPQLGYLQSIAGDTVKILGWQPRDVLKTYYAGCRAFLFPGEEDMGVTHLEANACGRPVIAYAKGGVPETVLEGETGILFPEQTVNSLAEAVLRFSGQSFDKERIRAHAVQFDESVFKQRISRFVNERFADFQKEGHLCRE